jgi:hypothetical protein
VFLGCVQGATAETGRLWDSKDGREGFCSQVSSTDSVDCVSICALKKNNRLVFRCVRTSKSVRGSGMTESPKMLCCENKPTPADDWRRVATGGDKWSAATKWVHFVVDWAPWGVLWGSGAVGSGLVVRSLRCVSDGVFSGRPLCSPCARKGRERFQVLADGSGSRRSGDGSAGRSGIWVVILVDCQR